MEPTPDPAVQDLLERSRRGEPEAASRLFELLYGELRHRARAVLQDAKLTIQPTVLVHEAWLRLVPGRGPSFLDRSHFVRVAAKAMRSVLIDHARARRAAKRGGGRERLELDAILSVYEDRAVDLVELDEALERLNELDPELARIVELRFFAGLEIDETARALDVSPSTVDRGWRTARTWLRSELGR